MLFSTIIFLSGGILGTFHHLYFSATPTGVLALGATFSALEIVPPRTDRDGSLPQLQALQGNEVDRGLQVAHLLLHRYVLLELPRSWYLWLRHQPSHCRAIRTIQHI